MRIAAKTTIRILAVLAGLALLFLALSAGTWGDASATAHAPAYTADKRTDEPRAPAAAAHSDSPVIREAHSDGGYWYWLEHRP